MTPDELAASDAINTHAVVVKAPDGLLDIVESDPKTCWYYARSMQRWYRREGFRTAIEYGPLGPRISESYFRTIRVTRILFTP